MLHVVENLKNLIVLMVVHQLVKLVTEQHCIFVILVQTLVIMAQPHPVVPVQRLQQNPAQPAVEHSVIPALARVIINMLAPVPAINPALEQLATANTNLVIAPMAMSGKTELVRKKKPHVAITKN